MARLPIVIAPDPILKAKAKPVPQVDDDLRRLMDDMAETMYAAPGIGLAAPQIAVLRRVIVLDVAREGEPPNLIRMANPEILRSAEERSIYNEGCLSLPDFYAEIERPAEVEVRYIDYENRQQTLRATGLLATCVQHEIDHLNGILFVDHLSALKRNIILRKLVKIKKAQAEEAL